MEYQSLEKSDRSAIFEPTEFLDGVLLSLRGVVEIKVGKGFGRRQQRVERSGDPLVTLAIELLSQGLNQGSRDIQVILDASANQVAEKIKMALPAFVWANFPFAIPSSPPRGSVRARVEQPSYRETLTRRPLPIPNVFLHPHSAPLSSRERRNPPTRFPEKAKKIIGGPRILFGQRNSYRLSHGRQRPLFLSSHNPTPTTGGRR